MLTLSKHGLLRFDPTSEACSDAITELLSRNPRAFLPLLLEHLSFSRFPADVVPKLLVYRDTAMPALEALRAFGFDFSRPVRVSPEQPAEGAVSALGSLAAFDREALLLHAYRFAQLLMSYGASPLNVNNFGDSILHFFVRLSNIPDFATNGSSPSRLAEFRALISTCREKGVDFINTLNKDGKSVLQLMEEMCRGHLLSMATRHDESPFTDEEKAAAIKLFYKQ
jgi:hypothetical protein